MFMFKKKKRIVPTPEQEAKEALVAAVEDAIVTLGVINLYPEGPDKEAAKRKAEDKKFYLLVKIGAYDSVVAGKKGYISSHEIIEIAYRNFKK